VTLPAPLGPLRWPPGSEPAPDATVAPARQPPRLSIVTPSFNQGRFLEATIRSVLAQNYPDLEYFVIDGGSRDDSRAVIEHYAAHLTGWVSEPDAGQVEAIRKGLARCSGEWFTWINADDLLAPGALWRVAAAANDADLIAGGTQNFDEHGLRHRIDSRRLEPRALILEQLRSGVNWHQPGTWLKRAHVAALPLDEASHYRFDYELLIRYLQRHPRVRYLPQTLAFFRLHAESKTGSQGPRFRAEHVAILRRLHDDPEFAGLRTEIDLAERAVSWLQQTDQLLADRARPRLQRFGELLRGVREDPAARCTPNARRAGRRILMYGGRRT
jgi:glycosyltransferase involved in cell wall biosynthesis